MNVSLVMTIIGPDRPGLVGQLAHVIAEHGGNWLESRMAHLAGQFAGILRVEVPAPQQTALMTALRALDPHGLTVQIQPGKPVAAAPVGSLIVIEVVGHDRPGMVRQISHVLAQLNINVEELASHCESAPMSGEILFHAKAKVSLPPGCSLAQLQQALEKIATDLMVDISAAPHP